MVKASLFLLLTAIAPARGLGPGGTGYGCDLPCDGGDVNYEIIAKLETYPLPNSANSDPAFGGEDASMLTRTFVGKSGPFCSPDGSGSPFDGKDGPMGPCLTVNPGQTMTIKVFNDMDGGMERLRQHKASTEAYWNLTQNPAKYLDSGSHGPHWFGKSPLRPDNMHVTNTQDLPGWDASFDDVNLHVHGVQVSEAKIRFTG
jgi:hypothetical protein